MKIPKSTVSTRYPKFIRQDKALKRFSKQKKIFPRIGLDNCEESLRNGRKIVFSGSGNKGLWDIATMSMRGISSCQAWDNWHAKALVGSMMDPYCGIIYTTNGRKLAKGERMSKRSVVRFVVDRRTGKPALFMERVYPRYQSQQDEIETYNLFKRFLERKSGLRVVQNAYNYFIPESNAVKHTSKKSYRDSHIEYQSHPKYKRVDRIKVK